MSEADYDPVDDLRRLREEFATSLIRRTEGPAELVVSPEVWIGRKEARLVELQSVVTNLRAEREAAVARYDENIGHLEARVKALETELRDERATIERAMHDSRKPVKPKRTGRAGKPAEPR